MAAVESNMIELGSTAPNFSLPNTNPKILKSEVSLSDYTGVKGIVIAFICNHCPYVVGIKTAFNDFAREYQEKGIAVVAISANDAITHPADSPEKMSVESEQYGYTFPYLYDESQTVAKAYDAACTPDLYLFDGDQKLVYRGQFDDSRPGNAIQATGRDLRIASDALLSGNPIPSEQKPSIGCNIKWKS